MNSRLEKYEQGRREIEEQDAIPKLNFVWGFRFIVDILILLAVFYGLIFGENEDLLTAIAVFSFPIIFLAFEIIGIAGYFKRKAWSKHILSFFAILSLLNIPFGTVLSIIHFKNISKISFK